MSSKFLATIWKVSKLETFVLTKSRGTISFQTAQTPRIPENSSKLHIPEPGPTRTSAGLSRLQIPGTVRPVPGEPGHRSPAQAWPGLGRPIGAIGAVMNRVHQPRPLVVLRLEPSGEACRCVASIRFNERLPLSAV